jgi:TetR/AcrR family transcriptional regulator
MEMEVKKAKPNTPKRGPGKQTSESAEQTKLAIIEAGLKLFAARGFEATSLRELAQEVNVTHALILHYFGTKEEIWKASIEFGLERLAASYTHYVTLEMLACHDPVDLLKMAIRDFLEASARYPEITRLVMQESIQAGERLNYILARYDPQGEVMEPLFQRVYQKGYLKQFEAGPTFFLFLLTAGAFPLVLPALTGWAIRGDITVSAEANRHIERVIQILFPTDPIL